MLTRFFLVLVTVYASLSWLPQFFHRTFRPTPFPSALPDQGMDLFAVQLAAQRFARGLPTHFIDPTVDARTYPYSMRGVLHAYGNVATLAMLPFKELDFAVVKGIWLVLSVLALAYLGARILADVAPELNGLTRAIAIITLLALSGPVTLILERGNIEVFTPLYLYVFWAEYVDDRLTWRGAAALGFVIHLKIWPLLLLVLLVRRESFRALGVAIAVPFALTFALAPWFPVSEYLDAVRQQGDVTAEMHGWLGVSVYSLVGSYLPSIPWRPVSVAWLVTSAALIASLSRLPQMRYRRRSLFAVALVCSALAPGYLCDYCLISLLFLLPAAREAERAWVYEGTAALGLSGLLAFRFHAGLIKALALIAFVTVASASLWRARDLEQRS